MKKIKIIIWILCILVCGCGIYVCDFYHTADASAVQSTQEVKVSSTDFGYFFDGPGQEKALIFYPGAKVEDLSYAKLLKKVAKEGIDCFLVHMPCNLAVFGPNKAEKVMEEYTYDSWYLAGHSLGGVMAANYVSNHKVDGLILLASYSTKEINVPVLSIYGSNDQVLNKKKYQANKKYLKNDEEYKIDGGNHAQFGVYGKQKKDGNASISNRKQIQLTANRIVKFCR